MASGLALFCHSRASSHPRWPPAQGAMPCSPLGPAQSRATCLRARALRELESHPGLGAFLTPSTHLAFYSLITFLSLLPKEANVSLTRSEFGFGAKSEEGVSNSLLREISKIKSRTSPQTSGTSFSPKCALCHTGWAPGETACPEPFPHEEPASLLFDALMERRE